MAKGDYGEKNGMCERQLNWGIVVSNITESKKQKSAYSAMMDNGNTSQEMQQTVVNICERKERE